MTVLSDGDLRLRRFVHADRARLAELADNPNVAATLRNVFPQPYRLSDAEAWVALTASETRVCNFAVEWRGELAGCAGLIPMDDVHSLTAELGYWLGEPYWGKGLASRAVGLIIPHAFGELLFLRLQAMVFANNPASARVLEKNRFVREGVLRKHVAKNGAVLDAMLYARLRGE